MSMRMRRAKHEVDGWVEKLARFGYAAKGVVYMLIAVLALQVAVGVGGQTTDPRGALVTLTDEPFGQALLAAIALGLAGYAVWRLVQAFKDPDHEGSDAKGVAKRTAYGASGLAYASLAVFAAGLALPSTVGSAGGGGGGGGGGQSAQDWTGWLMSQPAGQWLVAAVGLVIIGIGLAQMARGWREKFTQHLKLGEMNGKERTWATRLGKLGLMAFGFVFLMIGGFMLVAAYQAQPQEARGLSGSLAALAAQPWGSLLLGLLAVGLVAYAAYQFVLARWRRIGPVTA